MLEVEERDSLAASFIASVEECIIPGTHGLNEELGRHMHRGREGKVKCTLCGTECEIVIKRGELSHSSDVMYV